MGEGELVLGVFKRRKVDGSREVRNAEGALAGSLLLLAAAAQSFECA